MSNFPSQVEIFVAGGGPAGLAAAIAARQAGFEVTVADCAQPPIDKACGEGIMPDGLAALRDLGVIVGSVSTAPFRGICFLDERDRVQAEFPNGVGYGIRRTVLHLMMLERANQLGVFLRWNARITGLSREAVSVDGQEVRYRWLICADGQNSRLRRFAGLDSSQCSSKRFGFRRHYRAARWSDHVEVHWGTCGQMYVTPVSEDEVCVALITRQPHVRFDEALSSFPALSARLRGAAPERDYRGAVTTTRNFAAIQSGNIALVGEASGSVDAVTGEGLSLAFRQALALAEALTASDLRQYEVAHRQIARLPRAMSTLMLAMDRHPILQRRTLRALSADPACFEQILAIHMGTKPFRDLGVRYGLMFGWNLLAA